MASIALENLGKIYEGGTRAVGNVNLEIQDSEFLVLVGPSGCGKSTILRMIAGLEDITEGKVVIGDQVINDLPAKDRDIAMVFQNYALYPHMSVRENLAFGLKLRKMPKQAIEKAVRDAAEILEITELLDRKPKALSGGQRQRVAMGRAIVRSPKAFLMDEPLSNLDAKLRVQMRTELSLLHDRLKTTTVYVTHDQTEAMTLGDRVAVLRPVSAKRPHNLEQVASPTELFNRPVNLFVAGFIGSPSMNMVYANLNEQNGEHSVTFGQHTIGVDASVIADHTGIEDYVDRRLVLGIRPSAFEAARFAAPSPSNTMTVTTTAKELLGSDTFLHFDIDSPPVITQDIEELLSDAGVDTALLGDATRFTARVSADVTLDDGSTIDLVIDTRKLHFFDPDTSVRIGA